MAWRLSRHFFLHQFVDRDNAHKVVRDVDALPALAAAIVRGLDVDGLSKMSDRTSAVAHLVVSVPSSHIS